MAEFPKKMACDPKSGLLVRQTDNGMKQGDLPASQEPRPLEMDGGIPKGWVNPDAKC